MHFLSFQPVVNGGECQPGEFCPNASAAPTPCTPGMHCETAGLEAPTGPCDAGWFCPESSTSAREEICPRGYFCPQQTDNPEPCRNGTYGDSDNLEAESECRACDPGYFCNETAATAVTGECYSGYYCPDGQTVPNPYDYRCPLGHFCVGGLGAPEICVNGFYQDDELQSDCKLCVQGYYCDNALGAIGSLSGYECPTGSYCPNGTATANQYLCPPGTFNNVTGIYLEGLCQPCLPGFYCQNSGLSEPEGPCTAG